MKSLFTVLCLVVFLNFTFAQQEKDSALFEPIGQTLDNIGFFDVDEPLKITLKYDITSFVKHKAKGEYLPAELAIYPTGTDSIVKDVRLKARGNFRRGHCSFPPIYLNFKTDPINQTELEGIRKVKMVTHCNSSKGYQAYVMREYLAYRIYNILSDNSFRVRLLDIDYIDTGKKKRHYQQKGFLIEPVELVTKRLHAIEVNSDVVFGKDVSPDEGTLVALYEYFIGNTDWRFKGGHNMKYIKSMDVVTNYLIPVPYDYDHAGIVNTSYAMPQEWSKADKVTERDYLGYCQTNEDNYREAIDLFNAKKDEIINTIETFEYLDMKDKKNILSFVNEFYVQAKQPKNLIWKMKNECRDIDF
ncbi:hypothetical protein [uncultured Draconibacterium sp.]|uniref:hypothetical protein n=1 Tax=uncultured Draconibacterium sp. TaxID=1573823 RepID=UPI0029C8CB99|nr:hypothetical protein [uncultured Draconibacterium sp.]